MADYIVDVLQLCSADNWFIGFEGDEIAEVEPLAAFALVLIFDADYPTLGSKKISIGLKADHMGEELAGKKLDDFPLSFVHQSKLAS